MRSLVMKLVVLVFFAGSNAFAEAEQEKESYCWGVEIERYQGTGTWKDDQGASGKLELVFVTEHRGEEENFWLTIKYDGNKRQVYAGRIVSEYPPYRLFGLGDYQVGTAVEAEGELIYRFSGYYTIVRSTTASNEVLSGTIEENTRTVSWEDLKLVFIKSVLSGC